MLPKVIFKIERWKWNEQFGVYASNLGNFRNNKKMPLKQKVGQGRYLLVKTKEGYKLSHRKILIRFYFNFTLGGESGSIL